MIEILTTSPLDHKGLCALAFQCETQANFPLLNWNVTFPDKPKPTPIPAQPPSVRKSEKFDTIIDFLLGRVTEINGSSSIRYSC